MRAEVFRGLGVERGNEVIWNKITSTRRGILRERERAPMNSCFKSNERLTLLV